MRRDMAKVIVERPRYIEGINKGGKPYVKGDAEDLPKYEGMRRPHIIGYSGKGLNENLAPLRRYLRSQVGRPWDKVFSEICENINVNSAVQAHIREHIGWYVEKDVIMVDGIPHTLSRYNGLTPLASNNAWRVREHLYVNPETGILCLARDKKKKAEKPLLPIKIGEHEFYDVINGNWFCVKTKWEETFSRDDYRYGREYRVKVVQRHELDSSGNKVLTTKYIQTYMYKAIKDKRQLSKKEIKEITKKYKI